MELSDEEKNEFSLFLKQYVKSFLLDDEVEIFERFIKLSEKKGIDFIKDVIPHLHDKNNITEIDINSVIPSIKLLSTSINKEEDKIYTDFFKIIPSIIFIFSEMMRSEGDLKGVLNVDYTFLNHLNKVNNRFYSVKENEENKDIFKLIDSWKNSSKERIANTKEEISFQKELEEVNKVESKTVKSTPILEWKGQKTNLSKLSRKLYEEKLTKSPTSFEKIFTEKIPTEWKGSIHCLAYFLYSLKHSFENNPKIIASDGTGYMKTALFYFTNCESKLLSQQKYDLSDLAYKVKNTKAKHVDTKRLIDKIIKETFQPK